MFKKVYFTDRVAVGDCEIMLLLLLSVIAVGNTQCCASAAGAAQAGNGAADPACEQRQRCYKWQ